MGSRVTLSLRCARGEVPVTAGPGDQMAGVGCGHLRASHADREYVVNTLKAAFVQGRLTKDELVEAIIHMAFYAGWPNGMTAITQLKNIIENGAGAQASGR